MPEVEAEATAAAEAAPRPEAARDAGRTRRRPAARLQHALDLAYRYLGHRDRTVAEMRRHLEAKRVEPADDRRGGRRARTSRATSTTRASRSASPRTAGRWTPGAPSGSSASCATSASRPSTSRRRWAPRPPTRHARPRSSCCAAACTEPPRDDRGRERALGLLVRRGYDLELAYDAVRAFERAA